MWLLLIGKNISPQNITLHYMGKVLHPSKSSDDTLSFVAPTHEKCQRVRKSAQMSAPTKPPRKKKTTHAFNAAAKVCYGASLLSVEP